MAGPTASRGGHAGAPAFEGGSFRDFDSRVYRAEGRVLRAFSAQGWEDWRALAGSGLLETAVADGSVVRTWDAPDVAPPAAEGAGEWAGVTEHEAVPFLSWPYEWTFGMLKDAALLQLDLLDRALDRRLILKDATPYNVQWWGAAPRFIDVGSFRRLREGEAWGAYRQFCMQFLYPLMLQALRGVDFHPFLRGSLTGISPGEMAALLRLRDRLHRGVLTHVVLHARVERRERRTARNVRRDLRAAGFRTEVIKANVAGLRRTIERLQWAPEESQWSEYGQICSYSQAERDAKGAFVDRVAADTRPQLVFDLGCNDGTYSRIAARHAGLVVAVDGDHLAVEELYRSLRAGERERILPLVADLADPPPSRGWRGRERAGLLDRAGPDLVLCLAVVHHLAITAGIPLGEVVDWLADFGCRVVVEFPVREDVMVQRLLDQKDDPAAYPGYTLEAFEAALGRRFEVRASEWLEGGTRRLYDAVPAAPS